MHARNRVRRDTMTTSRLSLTAGCHRGRQRAIDSMRDEHAKHNEGDHIVSNTSVESPGGTRVAQAIAMKLRASIWFPFVAGAFLALNAFAAAAQHVPIHGLTGTIALQGNVEKIYDGVNTVVVKALDGTEHVMHVTKGTKVHGGAEALAALQKGTPVVVHYTMNGAGESTDEIDTIGPGGLKNTEGVVMGVDRVRKTIS